MLIRKIEETINQEIPKINSQLEQKAEKVYVDNKIGNMGNTKTFKGSCLYSALSTDAIVDDYWYVTDKDTNYCWNGTAWVDIGNNLNIGDNTISKEKTNFIKKTINLFDKNNIVVGKSMGISNVDNLIDNASTNVSPKIYVKESTEYITNSAFVGTGVSIRCFTSGGSYAGTLTGVKNDNGYYTFTTLAKCEIIRFTYSPLIVDIDTLMVVEGSSMTEYVPFGFQIDEECLSETNQKIDELVSKIENMKEIKTPSLHLPLQFDFIIGEKGEIFDFGILDFEDYPINYCLNFESSSYWGQRHSNGRFIFDFVGKSPATISKYFHLDDINEPTKRLLEKTVVINSVNPLTNPSIEKNILMFGDSFMQYGDILREFDKKLHTDYSLTNYKLVGRVSKNSIKYEGTAGYSWINYVTNKDTTNPFYNSSTDKLDFKNYMNLHCGGVNLDYLIATIGVNNFSVGSTIEEVETLVKTFLTQLFTDYPDCKVILVGQHRQPYSCYRENDAYMIKKGKWIIKLNELYNKLQISYGNKKVRYVNMMAQFDYENGFTMTEEQVGRYSSNTKKYITDTTHPSADIGAKYYADGILAGFFAINQ